MKFALVTGVSKGLGESVAKFLLESQVSVIGISRTEHDNLVKIAEENDLIYKHFACDLGNIADVEMLVDRTQRYLSSYDVSLIYIINNAATLKPVDPAMRINSEELQYHFDVNVISPMVLLNAYLNRYAEELNMIVGVNVTSGAAKRPVYGWSAYSSSKASIDAYTKTVALELDELGTGNKVIAFNPGVMDTNMQEQIRSTDKASFLDVETFKSYKLNNILKETDVVAGVLVDILTDEVNIENGKTYDINDYF